MPDTYTSQFSGEEIDAALRAAQIISGADTPAALRKKLEIRGDTIPVSAEDSTLISEALTKIPTTSGGGVNPNLLDNWFFGRPVNQRNGYYIPAGVKYNTLSWTEAGTTDKAYPVIGYIGQDPLIAVNGTNYIVGKSVQVPGYCAAGYTVDRWFLEQPYNLKIDATGLHFTPSNLDSYTNLIQQISVEKWTILNGKTITVSALTSDGKLLSESGTWTPESGPAVRFDNFEFSSAAFVNAPSYQLGRLYVYAGKSADVLAVKVELGSTQTLAHQENGVWILNEIPDFGEQLRRCTYYAEKVESKDTAAITNSTYVPSGATSAVFILPYARKRTVPAINFNDVSNYRIIARSISGATTAFSVTAISPLDVGRTKAAILVSFNATDQGFYCFLQRSDNAPAGYAFISADL